MLRWHRREALYVVNARGDLEKDTGSGMTSVDPVEPSDIGPPVSKKGLQCLAGTQASALPLDIGVTGISNDAAGVQRRTRAPGFTWRDDKHEAGYNNTTPQMAAAHQYLNCPEST